MARLKLDTGEVINFEGEPTEEQVKEAIKQVRQKKQKKGIAPDIAGTLGSILGGGPAMGALTRRLAEKATGTMGRMGRPEEFAVRSALNSILLGIPRLATEQLGGQFPQARTTAEQVSGFGGGIAGLTVPGGAIAKGVGKVIKGARFGAKVARGAVTGGVIGGVIPPETSFTDLKARGKQAIMGVLLGAGTGVIGAGIGKIREVRSPKAQAAFARKLRAEFNQVKTSAVNKFGDQLDDLARANPDRTVSVRDIIDDVNNPSEGFTPELKRIAKRVPKLRNMLNKPELADNVKLKDVQEIINHIDTKIPNSIKFKHLDILNLKNDVKAAQLDAFPEMAQVRSQYAEVIQPFNQVKAHFKFNRVIRGIQQDFGGPEGKEAVEALLSKETIKDVGGFKKAIDAMQRSKQILRDIIRLTAVGAAAGAVGAAVTKK